MSVGCGARVRPMALPLPVLPRAIPAVSATAAVAVRLKWLGVPDLPRPRSTRAEAGAHLDRLPAGGFSGRCSSPSGRCRSRLLSRVLPNVRRPAGGVAWQNDRMAYIQVDIFETATRAGRGWITSGQI
jgi:hypothetical protein